LKDSISLGDALDLAGFPDEASKLKQQMIGVRQTLDQHAASLDISGKAELANATRIDAHWRSTLVIQLSTITMLIDAKLITIEEAALRIEQIHSSFAESDLGYSSELVVGTIKRATDWLRAHEKKPIRQWSADILQFPGPRGEDDK
jgi:hypothetical protein